MGAIDGSGDLIGSIYDAAVDDGLWQKALDQVTDHIGGRAGALVVRSGGLMPYEVSAMSAAYAAFFEDWRAEHYLKILRPYEAADWAAVGAQPLGEILRDENIGPPVEVLDRRPDRVFAHQHAGIRRRIGARLNDNKGWYDGLAIGFGDEHARVPDAALARLRPLLRHFGKSVEMARVFRQLDARYQAVLAALDHVGVGLMIATASGEVIARNAEADRILGEEDGLRVGADLRLHAPDEGASAAIGGLILKAARTAQGEDDWAEASMLLPRASGRVALVLDVRPLSDARNELGERLRGALITLIDPARRTSLRTGAFAAVYGLTPAEEAVCRLVAEGHSRSEIAERRDVSPETVKKQLAAVFTKCEVSRVNDLVRLVVRTCPPIGVDDA